MMYIVYHICIDKICKIFIWYIYFNWYIIYILCIKGVYKVEVLKPYEILSMNCIDVTKGYVYEMITNLENNINENVVVYLVENEDELFLTDSGATLWEQASLGQVFNSIKGEDTVSIVNNSIIYKLPQNSSPTKRKLSLYKYLNWIENKFNYTVKG